MAALGAEAIFAADAATVKAGKMPKTLWVHQSLDLRLGRISAVYV